jgi:hypothetical protein
MEHSIILDNLPTATALPRPGFGTKPITYTTTTTFGAYCRGCEDARAGEYCLLYDNPLDSPEGAAVRRAHRVGFMAELVRIANRRMTGEQRDLLIAHDRAVAAWKRAPADRAYQDDTFVRADMALFGLNPWVALGIRLGEYQGPAAQAGRL